MIVDDFDILIQKIQEARNPKYFLWQIIKDIEWVDSDKYVEWITGKKNGFVYFEYDKRRCSLHYSYTKIYKILESKYKLGEYSISNLLKELVSEQLSLPINSTSYRIK
jgi:viroplasmin and RNaseH domain-containing protein